MIRLEELRWRSRFTATFSIAARDGATGMLGVAVASRVLAVGASCPFVQARVGAICVQSYTNPELGFRGLSLLAEGLTAQQTLDRLLAGDEGRDWRQIQIVDDRGDSAAFTGTRADLWKGTRIGPNYALGGNLLTDEQTVEAMERTFNDLRGEEFGERMLRTLEAGDATGGDRRGKQSAAIYVAYRQPFPYLNLRVDDHHEPVKELRRLFELAKETGVLSLHHRIADTLESRTIEETVERQRAMREKWGVPTE